MALMNEVGGTRKYSNEGAFVSSECCLFVCGGKARTSYHASICPLFLPRQVKVRLGTSTTSIKDGVGDF